eukprot:CAMPEP_0202706196 /NCGR_PEP_ID=MMETSP1385-20130828/18651_1 /ASSEMBLY_ACC=CAM_ASM_000861 /TAXON_ID=933848 /ORGANISM="Elphidium margaritaceum" /LENGTH=717 /DNA_ID=CAMNT_0049364609 /DNA_START=109 /DNA_END=2262 /DNA_ORIENTATION=-
MGGVESRQKLGERVTAARKKLQEDSKMQSELTTALRANSSSTLNFVLDRMEAAFDRFSPFLERSLLVAWSADSERCKGFALKACKKVLSAPIKQSEYDWFKQYVMPSSIWMQKTKDDRFMYEELMTVVKKQSLDIVQTMDSVFNHLQTHPKWQQLMAIEHRTVVDRQDHKQVGLLKDDGIQRIADEKDDELRLFVDSDLAITDLATTAQAIDHEFQTYIESVMGHYGTFRTGPLKKVERCLSKLENDYADCAYPKSAKLLDLVRCSVTFNTLEQLLLGYDALMADFDRSQNYIKLARVKNGFLDKTYDGGYRDVKVNVIFQSAINPQIKMICEVQLVLSQYLLEKKRIHKLYNIAREEMYFQMVVKSDDKLQLKEALNAGKQVVLSYDKKFMYKCAMESDMHLLAMESRDMCAVVDIKQKKEIFTAPKNRSASKHTVHWLRIKEQKYLAVQLKQNEITMFKVVTERSGGTLNFLPFKIAKKDASRSSDKEKANPKFVEDSTYKITVDGKISHIDFDHTFEHVLLVIDDEILQIRQMSNVQKVQTNIKLREKMGHTSYRSIQLSANGRFCALAGGLRKSHFWIIDFEAQNPDEQQQDFQSEYLMDTFAPCFINSDTQFISVCDGEGRMEIWDLKTKKSVKTLQIETKATISSSASTHNVLAIGSVDDKTLRLYDVRSWECFYSKDFNFDGNSLDLTNDLKYVTFSGEGGDRCVVLKIQ